MHIHVEMNVKLAVAKSRLGLNNVNDLDFYIIYTCMPIC